MLATLQSGIDDRTHDDTADERINRGASALNRQALLEQHVVSISLFGGPGCGKTTLLEATMRRLCGMLGVAIIFGNIRAERDAQRLRKWCKRVAAVETSDLTPALLREAIDQMDLKGLDVLFIERGAAAPPLPQDLGQALTVGIFSVAGGDDKVEQYTERVRHADLVLLTKTDLLTATPFDVEAFIQRVREVNPAVPILAISSHRGEGMEAWCNWVRQQVRRRRPVSTEAPAGGDYFVG